LGRKQENNLFIKPVLNSIKIELNLLIFKDPVHSTAAD